MACSCVASVDAVSDLGICNIMQENLLVRWGSEQMRKIRAGFTFGDLNKTCGGCDMYRDLELYRTSEGRERARLNRLRHQGSVVKRMTKPSGYFSGG